MPVKVVFLTSWKNLNVHSSGHFLFDIVQKLWGIFALYIHQLGIPVTSDQFMRVNFLPLATKKWPSFTYWILSKSPITKKSKYFLDKKSVIPAIVQWATACLCIEFFTVTSQPFHSGLYFNLKSKSTFFGRGLMVFQTYQPFQREKANSFPYLLRLHT